ncbi:hypothetical protein ACF0H5_022675 [Mactra antiquata]
MGKPKPEKNKTKDVKPTKTSVKKEDKDMSYLPSKYMFLFVGILAALTAVILTNDDLKLYLVKLTPMGSQPLETIMNTANSESSSQTGPGSEPVVSPEPIDPTPSQATKKSNNDEKESDDKKMKKKDYKKSSITNKADFKLRKQLDEADDLLQQRNVDGAIRLYDDVLRENSKSPRALFGKGMSLDILAEQKRSNQLLGEAISSMDAALRAPNVPAELLRIISEKLAERQTFRGWNHKAAQTWKYMSDKYPDNVDYKRKLTVSYLTMGDNVMAREILKNILDKNPKDGFSLVHLGFILKTVDLNYEEGSRLLQEGIDTQEHGTVDGRFYYHLGDAYMRINRTDMSSKVYKKGAELGLFLSEHQRSLYNAETKLTGRPWWTPEQTPYGRYLAMLEKNWETIRDEGLSLLDQKTGGFLPEEENLREKGDWKQFTLYQRGKKNDVNCRRTPKTCALLDQVPDATSCTRGQIKFSVMHPGVHVWPHTGPTNCRLRAHLGLRIPEGPRIRVADKTKTWKEGKFIIIDDSFEHEVWHDGTESRLILIVDFWHPDIPLQERRTLSPI